MAAPSHLPSVSGGGATDAGGAWAYTCGAPSAAGLGAGVFFIVQVLQDGNTNGAVTQTGATNIENLAGTDNAWTQLTGPNADGSWPCGVTTPVRQHIWFGRSLSASAPTISGGNSTSEDLYIIDAAFSDVNTGSTLSAVIENSTAGTAVNGTGTGTAITDTGVTTLGVDRLALNLLGADDDGIGSTDFVGESGGTWIFMTGFSSASGTDGTVWEFSAAMASAGTINGGTLTSSVSVNWGIVGFALIGTTVVATIPTRKTWPALQAVNRAGTY